MQFLSKYGVARHIYVPIVKRAAVDFAVSADWTPASGDVKISKDGGAAANVTNLPSAITMGNTAMWDFSLTATEMQAAQIVVMVADSATKAVEDQSFIIETYGNASGQHPFDLATATQSVNVTQFGGSSGTFASGRPEVNTSHVAGTAQTARDLGAQLDAAVTTRLAPTTAGRTLDVSATGEAGIDWANIGSPTTVVALSGTTVKTATDVETDTADIQSRLPAALVSGRIDASVGAVAANAITAAAIADGAIDRATFAADTGLQTIRSNTAQGGSVSDLQLDAGASAIDDFYNGMVLVLTGGTGVGQARVISDYVSGSKLAQVDRNWVTPPDGTTTFAILGRPTPKMGSTLGVASVDAINSGGITAGSIAADAITAAKIADGAIDAATFAAGAINAAAIATDAITAGKIAADAIGASELAADAITEIQSGLSTLTAAGVRTAVGLASANLDTQLAALPTAAANADAVWDETLADHLTAGSTGAGLNAAGSAGDPWGTALPGAYGAGTAGKIVGDNLNATVSSRSSHSAADVWASATRSLTDKAGFALSSAGIQAIWDALTSALTTVGSIGRLFVDNINATISSRSTLTAAQVNTEADTALADVGLTSTVTGRIDAAVSSRLASGTVAADVTAIKAKTDNLPASPAATGDIPSAATVASQVRTELTTELGRMDAAVSTRATPAQVNAEVVDALTVDASAEPTAVPAANAPVSEKLAWLYALGRNRVLQTSSAQTLRNDADSADIASANVSDDGSTFERSEWQ